MEEDNERKRRIQWKTEAEEILINLWAEKFDELKTRNAQTIEEIVTILDSQGYPFSIYEVKGKIHNLTNRYREERRAIAISGGSVSSKWPAFEKVHSILGKLKNFDFENNNSICKTETSTEFALVQSDSLMENELLSEDNPTVCNEAENVHTPQKYTFKQNSYGKRKSLDVINKHDFVANTKFAKFDETPSSSHCFNKLSETVDEVVNFIMKTKNNKSRNASFLRLLDSYLLQLPEKIQDSLKVELLNIVYNKINTGEKIVNDS